MMPGEHESRFPRNACPKLFFLQQCSGMIKEPLTRNARSDARLADNARVRPQPTIFTGVRVVLVALFNLTIGALIGYLLGRRSAAPRPPLTCPEWNADDGAEAIAKMEAMAGQITPERRRELREKNRP